MENKSRQKNNSRCEDKRDSNIELYIIIKINKVAGSGKKPFRQKGTGRARQGNLRAPGRKKGFYS